MEISAVCKPKDISEPDELTKSRREELVNLRHKVDQLCEKVSNFVLAKVTLFELFVK